MKQATNHWAAYLAASEQAAKPKSKTKPRAKRRHKHELRDMTGLCLVWFWSFCGAAAGVIFWLSLFGSK